MWNSQIAAPKAPGEYPDRLLDCETALQAAFQDLIGLASGSGWVPGEILQVLQRLIAGERHDEREEAKLVAYLGVMRAMEHDHER
jgi:hypothetical protein